MNSKETQTSLLISQFLNECFNNKSRNAKFSEYSASHSQSKTLSVERERHLSETEDAIQKIETLKSFHQIRSHIKNQLFEVQYFILERATILSVVTKLDHRLTVDSSEHTSKRISLILLQLWEQHLHHISIDGVDLDTHLSHIVHGHIPY